MTREQVHDIMEDVLRCVQRGNYCDRDCAKCPLVKDDKELIEAYGYVIKALEQEPQTFKWCTDCKEYDQEKHCCHRWSKVIRNTVEEMKKEQEPKTGHWIDREIYDADRWKCSECGRTEPYKENYCPNCGAKMIEIY